ncbi:MarR family winged helix-turn-helix transcriptional regulator [Flocculibacter collagenilyticus]|uniref:MarR family winged helix-turn-helix transcriptional regulator n=1 Tax=Flocculibacter collagenilyticus TaxID=2744479 RepID=UPI0018F6ECCF|nr:MarR family winged helix-turn-helix transcriptional regulator [Flocculibacter collagenilyticus]
MTDFENYINSNVAFTDKRLFDLFLLINEQADVIYKKLGIDFPVSCSPTVLSLSVKENSTVTDIAKALGLSHQLIAQRLKSLLKLKLIEKQPSNQDKRKILYRLSQKGLEQALKLDKYCEGAEKAFIDLLKEVGVDLQGTVNTTISALKHIPFHERYEHDE